MTLNLNFLAETLSDKGTCTIPLIQDGGTNILHNMKVRGMLTGKKFSENTKISTWTALEVQDKMPYCKPLHVQARV